MAITGIGNGYNMYGSPYDFGMMAGTAAGKNGAAAVRGTAENGAANSAAAQRFAAGNPENAASENAGRVVNDAGILPETAAMPGQSAAANNTASTAGGFMPGISGLATGIYGAPKIVLSATGMPLPEGSEAAEETSPEEAADPDARKKIGRKSSPEECQTCKERKYQDGSDENVSFKAAAHISPEAAGAAVRAHEGEHVSNAYKEAAENGGKVINASVMIHTAICPECGRTYVSGGTTNTTIRYSKEENPYEKAKKAQEAIKMRGKNIDYAA